MFWQCHNKDKPFKDTPKYLPTTTYCLKRIKSSFRFEAPVPLVMFHAYRQIPKMANN